MKLHHPVFQYVLLCIIIVKISACSNNPTGKTEEQKEKEIALKYHIKSISEYKNAFQFGTDEKEKLSHFKFFSEDGLKQKEVSYSDETIENTTTNEYDNNGNVINSTVVDANGEFLFKVTMNYYENNLRKELYIYLPSGTYKYRTLATYGNEGKMIELKYYWPDGLKAQNKFKYEGNNKIEDTECAPDGTFRYKWIYKYDKNNNLIDEVQYYPKNKINRKISYEYNSDNLLIKQSNYFEESIQDIVTFEYNNNKLLSSKTETTSGGMISAKYRYQYEFY